ncbi:hypothetical protein BC937DRAFT_90111, partial [Endogone sp. FLAS-F59071]
SSTAVQLPLTPDPSSDIENEAGGVHQNPAANKNLESLASVLSAEDAAEAPFPATAESQCSQTTCAKKLLETVENQQVRPLKTRGTTRNAAHPSPAIVNHPMQKRRPGRPRRPPLKPSNATNVYTAVTTAATKRKSSVDPLKASDSLPVSVDDGDGDAEAKHRWKRGKMEIADREYLQTEENHDRNDREGDDNEKDAPEEHLIVEQGTVCLACGVSQSCRWRIGPQGPKTLCNACGLRWINGGWLAGSFSTSARQGVPGPSSGRGRKATQPIKAVAAAARPASAAAGRLLSRKRATAAEATLMRRQDDEGEVSARHRCQDCGKMESSAWRRGPGGPSTLCNACGLRWRSKNPSLDFGPRVRGSNRQQKRILKSAAPKPPAVPRVKTMLRVKAARMTVASLLSADLSPSVAAADEVDRPAWLSKEFLRSGLYSNDLKAVTKRGPGRRIADKKGPAFQLPLPMHYGDAMLKTETDFFLTHDIIDGWERGMFNEAVQRNKVPEAFIRIRSNAFVERKPDKAAQTPVCNCTPPPNGEMGCKEDCFNRLAAMLADLMMFYECSPKHCPCGDKCSNQRFQKKEGIKELDVFWLTLLLTALSFHPRQTHKRGFGLRTLVPISRNQLIIEYRGEIISQNLCQERMQTAYKNGRNFYFLDYQHGEVVDACVKGTEARFVNHSCDPNCHIEKWSLNGELFIGIFSSRDISPGSELFYDYNFTTFSGAKTQNCHCGSAICRGVIGQRSMAVKTAPPEVQSSSSAKKGKRKANAKRVSRGSRKVGWKFRSLWFELFCGTNVLFEIWLQAGAGCRCCNCCHCAGIPEFDGRSFAPGPVNARRTTQNTIHGGNRPQYGLVAFAEPDTGEERPEGANTVS